VCQVRFGIYAKFSHGILIGSHSPSSDRLLRSFISQSETKYQRGDQIHTVSGTGMDISFIGQTTFSTLSRNILLKDILYVPKFKKNLVSVHRLTFDNSVFLELHPTFFLV
jgi:hypothetical protein